MDNPFTKRNKRSCQHLRKLLVDNYLTCKVDLGKLEQGCRRPASNHSEAGTFFNHYLSICSYIHPGVERRQKIGWLEELCFWKHNVFLRQLLEELCPFGNPKADVGC